jgi:hypothetical protein
MSDEEPQILRRTEVSELLSEKARAGSTTPTKPPNAHELDPGHSGTRAFPLAEEPDVARSRAWV